MNHIDKVYTIFLDIDGVLNNQYTQIDKDSGLDIEYYSVIFLKEIINCITDLGYKTDIVISSDWRYHEEMLDLLSSHFSIPTDLETIDYSDLPYSRETIRLLEIENYINDFSISNYMVIDDMDIVSQLDNSKKINKIKKEYTYINPDNVFKTTMKSGLNKYTYHKILKYLSKNKVKNKKKH